MGKVALVTGGAGGIGSAICRQLARDGYYVLVHYHTSEAAAKALAGEIGGMALMADLSRPEGARDLFRQAEKWVPGVDLLVNNAGLSDTGLLEEAAEEDWMPVIQVDLCAVIRCCQLALPYMRKKNRGNIINISSIWGMTGAAGETVYSAAKAGVIGFTKALAKEVALMGIRVNCVAPGAIRTAMIAGLGEETLMQVAEETPMGRLGSPEEGAAAVSWLASEQSSFVTGQVISPNGGLVI